MKKIISITLVLVLVLSSVTFAFADSWKNGNGNGKFIPPGLAKKEGLPPGIAKKFKDINGYDWAKEAIEKMADKGVIFGDGNGKFGPQRSVTKLEAIAMALRVMGEESEAREYQIKIKNSKIELKFKDNLQEWAYGYVKLAEEKGILDKADLLYFKLNEAATRHEVAKYLVRAMGYEDKAQKYMDADLDYKDAAFIPQGSVGYIYVANKEQIITGYPDGTFKPFNKVTRAQMAVMVARLEGKFDDDFKIYTGEVTDIDDGSRIDWIELDDDKKIEITSDTKVVFDDQVKGNIEDIKIGDDVKVKVNEDDEAVYIEVDGELSYKYEGEVTDIDDGTRIDWIELDDDKKIEITSDAEVVFDDNVKGDIEDIKIGYDVKVKVNKDDEAVYIKVDEELSYKYDGEVTDIDDGSRIDWIELDDDKKIEITSDTEVVFDDNVKGDIEDIKMGYDVKVKVNKDDKAVYIKVNEELSYKYEGEVTDIDDGTHIDWIELDDDKKIEITSDTEVVFDDNVKGDVEDIEKGDDVKIKVNKDDEAVIIVVEKD
ncbi:S-layer homology domain-containing protein [Anaerovorax sp. IOR16]|uniref:S-layer homology domain-containing protein n=1 Tax=Anaerovorax sp. IOR16 TaxID=2773458 RepID=UPI0019D033C3|nr:S-layer homology domain-containing protein [Anaerovorax sp. IOR16]